MKIQNAITGLACTVFILVFSSFPVFAESFFLKDGSIIEGKIINESDNIASIKFTNDTTREIKRKNILRIVYGDEYKNKVFIYDNTGKITEGYIVDSNAKGFIYRKDLASKEEFALFNSDVFLIVRKQVDILKHINIAESAKKEHAAAKQDETSGQAAFLKNGSIVAGKISEGTGTVTVIEPGGKKQLIERKDILRISYTNTYKRKVSIYKMNDDIIEAYIVNEANDSYTLREELISDDETVLKKSKINFISKFRLEEPVIRSADNNATIGKPSQKTTWDSWYIIAGMGPAFPTGVFSKTLSSGKDVGPQIDAAFQYFLNPNIDGTMRLFTGDCGGKYYNEQDFGSGNTHIDSFRISGILFNAGYSFALIDNRLNLHLYSGTGFSIVNITYLSNSMLPGNSGTSTKNYWYIPVVIGAELPVRLFNWNDYCALYTEYLWLPDIKSNMGFINIGLRYAF